MLRLRHLRENLEELDQEFERLAVNAQSGRTSPKNRFGHRPDNNKKFLGSINCAMERSTRTNSKGITFGDDSRVERAVL
ncbi:UNVERIFIED_CONTAM: hypothetical protein Slati_4403000 [Sesamum latifolium]|uniref:Uncharacterized protein n=1 Tax=Sesamum latifolium TaxID=2727402 RepID=A0AAW2SRB2_9LAMI